MKGRNAMFYWIGCDFVMGIGEVLVWRFWETTLFPFALAGLFAWYAGMVLAMPAFKRLVKR